MGSGVVLHKPHDPGTARQKYKLQTNSLFLPIRDFPALMEPLGLPQHFVDIPFRRQNILAIATETISLFETFCSMAITLNRILILSLAGVEPRDAPQINVSRRFAPRYA